MPLLLTMGLGGQGCAPIDRSASAPASGVTPTGIFGQVDSGARGVLSSDSGSVSDDAGLCGRTLRAVTRDFRGWPGPAGEPKHPDFQNALGDDRGIVATMLGADNKPVYASASGTTRTTSGRANFDQWYRNVSGVNLDFEVAIALTEDPARPGTFVYDSDNYYPIDNEGFGNQSQTHNYSFTSELHFNFPYRGGERFIFRGDDDLWLFVNGQLAIDIGGVHVAETGMVSLDQRAAQFGITPGNTYRMDIFQAERHTENSTFHVETTLACIDNVIIP